MSTRRPLFPGLTTVYLKSLGELLLCANRLQRELDSDRVLTEAWRGRADELVAEALCLADAVAVSKAGEIARATLPSGVSVIADLDYVDGLVRKMHRHHALSIFQAPAPDGELIAS